MLIKIGELARRTGASVETIRYYEKEQLLPVPARSAGNYRLYRDVHIERLQFILHCRMLDIPLDDIRLLLDYWDDSNKECEEVNELIDKHIQIIDVRIKELAQLKKHLMVLRQKCANSKPAASCGILNALADSSCHK